MLLTACRLLVECTAAFAKRLVWSNPIWSVALEKHCGLLWSPQFFRSALLLLHHPHPQSLPFSINCASPHNPSIRAVISQHSACYNIIIDRYVTFCIQCTSLSAVLLLLDLPLSSSSQHHSLRSPPSLQALTNQTKYQQYSASAPTAYCGYVDLFFHHTSLLAVSSLLELPCIGFQPFHHQHTQPLGAALSPHLYSALSTAVISHVPFVYHLLTAAALTASSSSTLMVSVEVDEDEAEKAASKWQYI